MIQLIDFHILILVMKSLSISGNVTIGGGSMTFTPTTLAIGLQIHWQPCNSNEECTVVYGNEAKTLFICDGSHCYINTHSNDNMF
jgi:hypothetical protein